MPIAPFYVLAIAMFVQSVAVCEMITYELKKVFDSYIWPWKCRSMTLMIWKKIGKRTYFVLILLIFICVQKLALQNSAVCSRYISWPTYGHTDEHIHCAMEIYTAPWHYTVPTLLKKKQHPWPGSAISTSLFSCTIAIFAVVLSSLFPFSCDRQPVLTRLFLLPTRIWKSPEIKSADRSV